MKKILLPLLLPLVVFAQGSALQTPDMLWSQAQGVAAGKLYASPEGGRVLRVLHSWKGAARAVPIGTVSEDSWGQPLRDGEMYVVYRGADATPLSVTSLDRSTEFSFLSYVELAVWLAVAVMLRMLWMLLPPRSARSFLRLTAPGLLLGTLAGLLLAPLVDPFLPPFLSIGIPPFLLLLGGAAGSLAARRGFLVPPRFIALPFLPIGALVISYLFDPLAAVMLATAAVLLADAARRALWHLPEESGGGGHGDAWAFLGVALLSYVFIALDLWLRWANVF